MTNYEEIAAAHDFGKASARKTGRNPKFPYVPILIVTHPDTNGMTSQQQILRLAFATRAEAVACAEKHIAGAKAHLAKQLGSPRNG